MAMAGVDVALHTLASIFVSLSGLLTQSVYTAMYIGIDTTIAVGNAVDNTLRMLRGGSIVEVNQGLTVYLTTQNREL